MKLKDFFTLALITIILYSILFVLLPMSYKKQLEEWDNGKCECGGTYTFTSASKNNHYYVCDNCKNTKCYQHLFQVVNETEIENE